MKTKEETMAEIKKVGRQIVIEISEVYKKYATNPDIVSTIAACAFEDALLACLVSSLNSIDDIGLLKMQTFDYVGLLTERVNVIIENRAKKVENIPFEAIFSALLKMTEEKGSLDPLDDLLDLNSATKKPDPKDLN